MTSTASPLVCLVTATRTPVNDPSIRHNVYTYKSTKNKSLSPEPLSNPKRLSFSISSVEGGKTRSSASDAAADQKRREARLKGLAAMKENSETESLINSGASTPLKKLPNFLNLLPNRLMPVKRTPVAPPSKVPVPVKGTEASALEKITKNLIAAKPADESKPVVESKPTATSSAADEAKPAAKNERADEAKHPSARATDQVKKEGVKEESDGAARPKSEEVLSSPPENKSAPAVEPAEKSKLSEPQRSPSTGVRSSTCNGSPTEKIAEEYPVSSALQIEEEESWRQQGNAEYHHTSPQAITQRVGSSRGRDDLDAHRELIRSADGDRDYHVGNGRCGAVKPVEVRAVEEQRCATPRSTTISVAPVLVDNAAAKAQTEVDMIDTSPSNKHRFNDDGSAGLAADFRRNGFHRDRDILRKPSRKRVHHLYPIAVPCPSNSNSNSVSDQESDEEYEEDETNVRGGYLSAMKEQYGGGVDHYPALPSVQLYPLPPSSESDRQRLGKPPPLQPLGSSVKPAHGSKKSKIPARLPSVQPNPTASPLPSEDPKTEDRTRKKGRARLPKVQPNQTPPSRETENEGAPPPSKEQEPHNELPASTRIPQSAAVQADLLSFHSEDFSSTPSPNVKERPEESNSDSKTRANPVDRTDVEMDIDAVSYTYDEETGEHYYYDDDTNTYYFYDQETGEYYYYDDEAETYFFYDDEINEYYYYDEEAGEYFYCEGEEDSEEEAGEYIHQCENSEPFVDDQEGDADNDNVSECTVEYLLVKSVRRRPKNRSGDESAAGEQIRQYPVAVLEGYNDLPEGDEDLEKEKSDRKHKARGGDASARRSSSKEEKQEEERSRKKKSSDRDRDQKEGEKEKEPRRSSSLTPGESLKKNSKKKKKSVEFQTVPTTTVIEIDTEDMDDSGSNIPDRNVGRRRPLPNAVAPPDPPSPCRYDVDEHPSVRPPSVELLTRSVERERRRKSSEKSRSNSILKTDGKNDRSGSVSKNIDELLASRSDSINIVRYHKQHHDTEGAKKAQYTDGQSQSSSTSSMYILIPLDSASEPGSTSVASRSPAAPTQRRKSSTASGKKEKKAGRRSRDNSVEEVRARTSHREKEVLLVPSSFFSTTKEGDLRRAINEGQKETTTEVQARRRSRPHTSPSEFHTIPCGEKGSVEKKDDVPTEAAASKETAAAPEKSKVSRLVERKRSLKSTGGDAEEKLKEKDKGGSKTTNKNNGDPAGKRTTEAATAAPQDRLAERPRATTVSTRARQAQQRRKQMILAYKAVTSDRIPAPPKECDKSQNADSNEAAPSSTAWNTLNPNYTRASHRPPQYLFPILQQPKLPKKPAAKNESIRRRQQTQSVRIVEKKASPRTSNRNRDFETKPSFANRRDLTDEENTHGVDEVSKWNSPREGERDTTEGQEPYLMHLLPTEVEGHDGTWLDGSLRQKPQRQRQTPRRYHNPFEALIMQMSPYNRPIKKGGFAQTVNSNRRRAAPQRKKKLVY